MSETTKGTNFTRTKKLTVGFVSMAHLKSLICRVLEPMHESEVEFTNSTEKSHPQVCLIADLSTGEEAYLICSAIIKSVFDKYGENLVGTMFEILQAPKIEGKKYRALDIYQIEKKKE